MRPTGAILIILGALLALPQIVTTYPYQPFVALGLTLAVFGGLLICDHEPRKSAENRSTNGHNR